MKQKRHALPIKWAIVLGALVLMGTGLYYFFNPLVPKLKIGETTFTYDLAITPQEIAQGLSGRDPLPLNHGMLFVFDHKEQYRFWMKDMKFPLDLLWIEDNTVVDISLNVPPPASPTSQLPTYWPKRPVNRVLEVVAGTVEKQGIKEGDVVTYLKR